MSALIEFDPLWNCVKLPNVTKYKNILFFGMQEEQDDHYYLHLLL